MRGARLGLIIVAVCGVFLLAARAAVAAPLRTSATAKGLFVGAAVNMTPFRGEPIYSDTLRREFNLLVGENAFKFDAVHPAQTTFNFTDTDALVAFAQANGMAIRGHTLVWLNQIPSWLTGGSFTRDQVIAILRDHITTVVGRYRGQILAWDVVNEAIDGNTGQLRTDSFWFQNIGPEYVAMAFQFAHAADPDAILYYNDFEAEGSGTKSDGVFNLVSGLVNQGVPIGGVGWQMHKVNPFRITAANHTNAQRLAALGLEISITEMDVRIQLPSDAQTLQGQALAYGDAVTFCLSEPSCAALVSWGFTDKFSWVPGTFSGFGDALMFDMNYQPKPAYTAMQTVLEAGLGNAPPVPTGLQATAGSGQVQLTWSASAGATSYRVKRATASAGPYTTVGTSSTTTFTNTGLTNGTTLFFVVSAVNGSGESANSTQVSATPQAAGFSISATPASLTINRGACGSSTIGITRTGGFTASVAFTVGGLPSGVTASFNPGTTTGATAVVTACASVTAAVGAATLTVSGTGGGLTRTTPVGLTVTSTADTGGVTVTPTVAAGGPWFNEQQVRVTSTANLTALSITIVIQRTAGVSFSGQYNTVGGQIAQSNSSTAGAITYQFALAAGQTLGPASDRVFAAQTSGSGTAHPASGDTYTVTYTTGGQSFVQSGHF
jgi:endo-1,4-beta-xylanase